MKLVQKTALAFLLFVAHSLFAMDKQDLGEQLIAAAQERNSKECKRLIISGADVNHTTSEGRTALEFASYYELVDVVKLLIKSGADVNHTNIYDGTALEHACITKKRGTAAAQLLIAAGANINHLPKDRQTALKYAAMNGNRALVELFINNGADVNLSGNGSSSVLYLAAFNGEETIVQLLVQAGAQVNTTDPSDDTILRVAAMRGSTAIIKLLIDAGANVNAPAWNDETSALIWAAINAHVSSAELLINAGANTFFADKNGKTALKRASERADHQLPICKLLVEKMLVDTQKQRLTTFIFCLKQKNYAFPGIYCKAMRSLIGKSLHEVIKAENISKTRAEIEKIEDANLRDELLVYFIV